MPAQPGSPPTFRGRLKRHPILAFGLGAVLLLAIVIIAGGFVRRPVNAAATSYDRGAGYRFRNTPPGPDNSDEIFVILAFSGGGTRAAAFSYGAMEQLAKTKIRWRGQERTLLNEVDIISSVSGGSFTAAYYGLFRERLFTDYPRDFLYKNFTVSLAGGLFNPLNWASLATSHFDRIDMAADLYGRKLFGQKTFRDLAALNARPFIVLNATDMTYVSRFEFTQDQFDFLGSDLSSYPVARGVAASSAFPVLLSPLTVRTYPHGADYVAPRWIADALANRQVAPREFATATVTKSYLNSAERPYVHLLDGGLSDNIGLRGPAYAMTSVQGPWSLKSLFDSKIKYLVVIAVNAKPGGVGKADLEESAPGVINVFSTVANGPMGNYSDETVQYLFETVESWRQDIVNSQEIARLRKEAVPELPQVKFYATELTFQDLPDAAECAILNALPTRFDLPAEDVDRVRAAAQKLIAHSATLNQLVKDLAQDSTAP